MQILRKDEKDGSNEINIFEEKEALRKQKKDYTYNKIKKRIKKMKTYIRRFLCVTLPISFIIYTIIVGISPVFSENKIYDDYDELGEDKELNYIVKNEMTSLTISKNIHVYFTIVYKDVDYDSFFENKLCVNPNNIIVVYNPVNKYLDLVSDIDYLVENYKYEDIKDIKKELPNYFAMIDNKLEKNVCLFDYYTIAPDFFKNKEALMAFLIVIDIFLVIIAFIKF